MKQGKQILVRNPQVLLSIGNSCHPQNWIVGETNVELAIKGL